MKKKQTARKVSAKTNPEPPHVWKVGDKVMKPPLQGTYEITRVSPSGAEVDLCLVGTDNFQLFRVRTELLTPVK
jgi:hypothetical protein